MKLTYDALTERFLFYCDYQNKRIPKEAGFRWNTDEKVWATTSSDIASTLSNYADDLANEQLNPSRPPVDAESAIAELGGTLLPFQKEGVDYALRTRRCFIADEPGLGKTVQALAMLYTEKAFPTIVVCPASMKLTWEREALKWIPNRTVAVWDASGGRKADIVVINYDNIHKLNFKLKNLKAQAIIFDESHYCKSGKTKRTRAAQALANGCQIRLCLSGTPVPNRPKELMPQLSLLGRLDEFGGWFGFIKRYCGAYMRSFGNKSFYDINGATNLVELNEKLKAKCFIRRRKQDVLTDLPDKFRSIMPLEITNRKEYVKAETEFIKWLRERVTADETFLESIADLTKEEQKEAKRQRADEAAQKALHAETLVKLGKLKLLAAEGKLEIACEWISSFLESGEKLVVFAWHKSIVEKLAKELDAPFITGETPQLERQKIVDRFQADKDCKLLIMNFQVGGVGITLTAASNVAFIEYGWNPATHDQAEDRCHRIGQKDQVTAWYLSAQNTIEDDISALIETKREIVSKVTDGVMIKVNQNIIAELLERMLQRQ